MGDVDKNYLKSQISKLGIDLTDLQTDRFLLYYRMLVEKNRVMNLTRITDFSDVVNRHFADSLAICRYIDFSKVRNILDLGTGAGFPGIPLAIVYPDIKITMIDSVGKKINFVNEVIAVLNEMKDDESDSKKDGTKRNGLNAFALHARAEDLAREKKYRERFDLCVSRAVANLSTLSEYCLPFVRIGGIFTAYKSGNSSEEIEAASNAVNILGGTEINIVDYDLEGMGRTLVRITKGKSTKPAYPRKAGIPGKTPLT